MEEKTEKSPHAIDRNVEETTAVQKPHVQHRKMHKTIWIPVAEAPCPSPRALRRIDCMFHAVL